MNKNIGLINESQDDIDLDQIQDFKGIKKSNLKSNEMVNDQNESFEGLDAYRKEEEVGDDLSSGSDDCLSELSNEAIYFENKVIYQKKALFYKNW